MKINDNAVPCERDILLDCLYCEQNLLYNYAQAISQSNIKNISLELENILTEEQSICFDIISQLEKLGNKENSSDIK